VRLVLLHSFTERRIRRGGVVAEAKNICERDEPFGPHCVAHGDGVWVLGRRAFLRSERR